MRTILNERNGALEHWSIGNQRCGKRRAIYSITPSLHHPVLLALLLAALHSPSSTFAQGSLTPPGAPAATMKTLQQVEPRTPISLVPITITNAGSYYLVTNLTAISGFSGITIAASGV